MNILEEISKFYDRIAIDEFHRYKSWEHCFIYFQNEEIEIDQAALQLAFYLASWGMYRGSSYLLWKDYKVHKDLIITLINNRQTISNLIYEIEYDEQNINNILKMMTQIKDYYCSKIKVVNSKEKEIKPSDTLATKVLLGINASVPAFDRFFITGLKEKNLGSKINAETLKKIFVFYRQNKKEFDLAYEYIKEKSGISYPPMKLVDMYFWEIGRKSKENT